MVSSPYSKAQSMTKALEMVYTVFGSKEDIKEALNNSHTFQVIKGNC